MNAHDVIARAAAEGVTLFPRDGGLGYRSRGPLPPAIRALLVANKADILTALTPAPVTAASDQAANPPLEPIEALGVAIVVCTTINSATAMVREVLQDAGGRPIGIDIETAPTAEAAAAICTIKTSEASLEAELEAAEDAAPVDFNVARLKVELRAARRAKAPEEIDRLTAELSAAKAAATLDQNVARISAELELVQDKLEYAESAALDPRRARVRTIQAYGGGRRAAVIDLFRTGPAPLALFEGLTVAAHNAVFELGFFQAAGVVFGEAHCTMQAARLVKGIRAAKLEGAAKLVFGIDIDKSEQTSNWAAPELSPKQVEYAAIDAIVAFRLAERLLPNLGPMTDAYAIQMSVLPAAARLRHRGVLFDLKGRAKLIEPLMAKRAEAMKAFGAACADRGLPTAVPETPNQVRAFLVAMLDPHELAQWKRTRKTGALSTERSTLRRIAHRPPARALVTLSEVDALLTFLSDKQMTRLNADIGRFHPSYNIAVASGGRASTTNPNVQGTSRDPKVRALFVAAPGFVFVTADFVMMELRAAAWISGDRAMTEAFIRGDDLHRLTAARISGKDYADVTPEERQSAKAVNFGSLFGMQDATFVEYAWKNYGVALILAEAAESRGVFFRSFPDLTEWQGEQIARCEREGRIVVGRDAANGIGRIIPLIWLTIEEKSKYNCSLNYPIQGQCADAAMLALAAIDRALIDAGIVGGPVIWSHDEFVCEVPFADTDRAKILLERAMVDAFAQTFPGAPLNGLAKSSVGPNWAESKA
jgi:DNA polymerase I